MDDGGATTPTRKAPVFALVSAGTVSALGSALTFVAIPWFVLQTTGSAAKTGLTGGAGALALVAAGLFAGPLVDRLGFKRTRVVADLGSAAAVALIPLLHHTVGLAFWQLLALVFVGGFLQSPAAAAASSLVPDLSRRAGMPPERTNSALEGGRRFALLAGPLLAGVLIAALGASNVLWIDAATFAASAALVAAGVPGPEERGAGKDAGAPPVEGYLSEILVGLRFVVLDRVMSAMLLTCLALNLVGEALYAVVLPVYAERTQGGAVDLGLMLGATGAGALAATILFGIFGHRLPRKAVLVASFSLLALPPWVLASVPPLAVAVTALVIGGIGTGLVNPVVVTVFQERTPPRMLGRMSGVTLSVAMVGAPLGMVACGFLLELAGLRPTLFAIGATFAAVVVYALLDPAFRRMGKEPPE